MSPGRDRQGSSRLERIRRYYERTARNYDSAMSGGLLGDRLLRRGRRGVGEAVRGRLLEVGIGSGLSLLDYSSDIEVTGVDISPAMLTICAQRARDLGRRVSLILADAERLPFPDAAFDSVAFSLSLCTIPDPLLAVREGLRVARTGAPLVFLEHVRSHLLPVALVQDLVNPLTVLFESDHFNRRTADTIRRGGVEVIRVDRWALGVFNLVVGRAPA